MIYRLSQDWNSWPEGSVISEAVYKGLYYLDRPLFDAIQDFELKDMIRYDDTEYCKGNGILFFLFYTLSEQDEFLNKQYERRIID